MSLRTRAGTLVAACTLGICGVASASAGHRSFEKTYPVASKLCANVAKGGGPKHLRPSSAKVLADCAALEASFKASQLAVLSAEASIAAARASQHAAVKSACAGTLAHRPSCIHAHHSATKALEGLDKQSIRGARAYFKAVEAARRLFWAEIHALPGGAHLLADHPIPVENS
jgi:hypothetical protein